MPAGRRATRILLSAGLLWAPGAASALELALPIACTPGEDCAIQHYVDRDPGPEALDYMCTHQTYEGHDGVDIRVPSLRAMAAGVAVLAAADGVVAGRRDGMPDRNFNEDPDSVKDHECGNGVLLEHAGGWQTQYCHMKKGSVRVREGDAVKAGTPLGEVGLSGMTEFPHVHFTVRRGDTELDPFALDPKAGGGSCAVAGDATTGLWTEAASAALAYRPAFVLNAGFSDGAVEADDIESGAVEDRVVTAASPALVFYGRAIGLEGGDIQKLVVTAPDGSVFTEDTLDPLDRHKAQYFAFAGRKRRDAPWPAGTWHGRYSVIRDGREIAFREATIEIGD